MNENYKKFLELCDQLLLRGENAAEFKLWQKIFKDLAEDDQKKLLTQMSSELKQLESL